MKARVLHFSVNSVKPPCGASRPGATYSSVDVPAHVSCLRCRSWLLKRDGSIPDPEPDPPYYAPLRQALADFAAADLKTVLEKREAVSKLMQATRAFDEKFSVQFADLIARERRREAQERRDGGFE